MGSSNRWGKRGGIRRKLLGYFLVLTILPLVILSYSAFINGRDSTEERVMAHLTSIADMKKSEIEGWLNERITATKDHANNYLLVEFFKQDIISGETTTEEEQNILEGVNSLLYYYKTNFAYENIYVTGVDGRVVASTDETYIDSVPDTDIVQQAIQEKDICIEDIHRTKDGKYIMQFCHPIIEEEVMGVILVKINMEDTLYPVIRSWPGMGETGETLLARIEGNEIIFINELRHSTDDPLTLRVPLNSELANPAQYATEGQSATIKALDYRGVEVVSAYRNIPLMNWGFVAKIDQTEAFTAVNNLLNTIIVSSFLLIVFAIVMGYIVSDRFASRIIDIEQRTKDISRGVFTQSLETNNDDEIGSLAQSVNQMSEQLQKTIEVERKLTENIAEANARQQYQTRLQHLYEHALELNNKTDEPEVAQTTLKILSSIIQGQYYTFLKVEGEFIKTSFNQSGKLLTLNHPIDGVSIIAKAVREKRSIIVKDTRTEPDYHQGFTDSLSELSVPIFLGKKVYGVINIESVELNKFDDQDRSILELLGLHVSSTIARISSQKVRDNMYEQLLAERMKTEQAMELDRLKTNFMSTATHEIRTPLTSIRGYSELIQLELEKGASPEAMSYFDVIQKNIDRLKNLTDDLLDLQRIESGRMHLDRKATSLKRLISQVQEEIQPILEGKKQRLVVNNESFNDEIIIDEMRIMQVLVNFISNANKYSDENTKISIGIKDLPEGLQLKVTDEGIGLKKEDIEKLFKPFPDIDMDHVRRGTGLGLSICKGIIELHNGKVDVESEGKGRGSTFLFEIPSVTS